MHRLIVRSKNTSCRPLRDIMTTKRVIYRMGSTTPTDRIIRNARIRNHYPIIEINSVNGCRISSDKILMKKSFDVAGIHTAEWFTIKPTDNAVSKVEQHLQEWDKIIAKHKNSSKGRGIYLITSVDDFISFKQGKTLSEYVFERYYTYSREYRVHVNKYGCFYTCRKMLRNGADDRWHRHANNSVFINENNPDFKRPNNWDDIVKDCIKAMLVIGLDIAAFDIKVNVEGTKFILMESNSAPSLGEDGIERYKFAINQILNG